MGICIVNVYTKNDIMRKSIIIILLLALVVTSCKKKKQIKPDLGGSTPVPFTTTEYVEMGTYDDSGRPNYLVASDLVGGSFSAYVHDMLPESVNLTKTHSDFLKNADLEITAKSDVYITFVSEVTSHSNTVGYYTYKTGSSPKKPEDIIKIIYIFPNASSNKGGTMKAGDKVKLGSFEPGTSLGFVLLDNAWDKATKKINKNAPHYCSNKELNPENVADLKYHTVLFDYAAESKVVIGFEDINRSLPECDNDFNDVVMYATVVK